MHFRTLTLFLTTAMAVLTAGCKSKIAADFTGGRSQTAASDPEEAGRKSPSGANQSVKFNEDGSYEITWDVTPEDDSALFQVLLVEKDDRAALASGYWDKDATPLCDFTTGLRKWIVRGLDPKKRNIVAVLISRPGSPEPVVYFEVELNSGPAKEAKNPIASISFVSQPQAVFSQEIMSDFQIEILGADGGTIQQGEISNSAISVSISDGAGSMYGNATVNAINGVATFSGLSIDGVGEFVLRASIAGTDSGPSAKSASFQLSIRPQLSLTLEQATTDVFCPRAKIAVVNIPSNSTKFCLKENDKSPVGCVFRDLPTPENLRVITSGQPVKLSIFFEDADGHKIFNSIPIESNEVTTGISSVPSNSSGWLALLRAVDISSSAVKEFSCRVDELTHSQGLALASIRNPHFDGMQRLIVSQGLNKMVEGMAGITSPMTTAEVHKVFWRLLYRTAALGYPLSVLNLRSINLTGRNLSGLDFAGTNIQGSQLNGIDPKSAPLKLSGLDLAGWSPATNQFLATANLSYATNIPWPAINNTTAGLANADLTGADLGGWAPPSSANINGVKLKNATNVPWASINLNSTGAGFSYMDFSGLDLSAWNPAAGRKINNIKYSGASNLPWTAININTTGYHGSDFSGVDLSGWNPGSTRPVNDINYTNSTNIPWAALNANSHTNGFAGSIFAGTDLSGWNPSSTSNISRIDYTNATNVPWVAVNANTNTMGYYASIFKGANLTGWQPPTNIRMDGIKYEGASNIPWAYINANTYATGLAWTNFTNVNLSGWNPSATTSLQGVNYTGASNFPWAAINSNTVVLGLSDSKFMGVNLSGWNPPVTMKISGIDYSGATNIPWTALNANTYGTGITNSNFTGVDLAGWNPPVTQKIWGNNYSGATNIPWAAINANTTSDMSYSNFSGLDLSSWTPAASLKISGIKYAGATNIPWSLLNSNVHSMGFNSADFSGLDLTNWSPSASVDIATINYNGATNIPWHLIVSTSITALYTSFAGADLNGFGPLSGDLLYACDMPVGAKNPNDFVEATGSTPYPGTLWPGDYSYPWGN